MRPPAREGSGPAPGALRSHRRLARPARPAAQPRGGGVDAPKRHPTWRLSQASNRRPHAAVPSVGRRRRSFAWTGTVDGVLHVGAQDAATGRRARAATGSRPAGQRDRRPIGPGRRHIAAEGRADERGRARAAGAPARSAGGRQPPAAPAARSRTSRAGTSRGPTDRDAGGEGAGGSLRPPPGCGVFAPAYFARRSRRARRRPIHSPPWNVARWSGSVASWPPAM